MTPPNSTATRPSLEFIDALRGVAIMGVVAVHLVEWQQPSTPFLRALAHSGTRGVQLFFVISAITLFMSMAARSRQEESWNRNFFVRRVFRIAPMFTCAILFYLIFRGTGPSYYAPHGIAWWHVLSTATYTHGWVPETIDSVVPGGWSIAVEMSFYLLVPLLFLLITNVRTSLLFLGITLILLPVANMWATTFWSSYYRGDDEYLIGDFKYFWLFSQLPVFAIGILTYNVLKRIQDVRKSVWGPILIFAALSSYAIFICTGPLTVFFPTHVLQSASFGLLALGLYLTPIRFIVNPVTCRIGVLSFSIYLMHRPVLALTKRIWVQCFDRESMSGSNTLFVIAFIVVVALSSLLATLTFNLVEQPGIRAGKRLIRWMSVKTTSAVDSATARPDAS